jgi:CubicO group peptidase (beta-lactamase class C family)
MGAQETMIDTLNSLDDVLVAAMNRYTLTGLSIGIVHSGTCIYAKSFGLAHVHHKHPVTLDTVFQIGSISKTVTALGLMRLYEQGAFQLDDAIQPYLKAYQVQHTYASAPPITFRHLLTHLSGLGSLRSLRDLTEPVFGLAPRKNAPPPELWQYYADGLRPELYPMMKHAYSNHAFATVGQLVEDISGQPFLAFMRENVFQPLGMQQSDYQLNERLKSQLAQGYLYLSRSLRPVPTMEVIPRPAGAVCSTTNDMVQYLMALLNGGQNAHGRVVAPETLALMMEPHYQADTRLPAMGLAFMLDTSGARRLVWHDGGWGGFASSLMLVPEEGLGVVVLSNTLHVRAPQNIAREVVQRLLDVPAPATQQPAPSVLETPHLWQDVCGFYGPDRGWNTNMLFWGLLGGEVEVFVQGNHLAIRSLVGPLRKGVRLYPVDPADPLVFQLDADQDMIWPPAFCAAPFTLVFKRNVVGTVDRLSAGFNTLYKRPWHKSLRFKALVGAGGVATAAVLLLNRKRSRL